MEVGVLIVTYNK